MMHRNVLLLCLVWPVMAAATFVRADAGAAPSFTMEERTFLSRLARRTVRDAVLGRDNYEPGYIPSGLEQSEVEVVIRLRDRGYLVSIGQDGPRSAAMATRNASLAAARGLMSANTPTADELSGLLIEIEAFGLPEPIQVEGDWTLPRVMDPYIEPGVHGMVLTGPRSAHRFCPTDMITSDLILADGLKMLAQQAGTSSGNVSAIQLSRFRTSHWYEPRSGEPVVSLHRGLTVLAESAVNRRDLDRAIERLAEYMIYRQRSDGWFSYQYEPGQDAYADDDNSVRQSGAALAMSLHARIAKSDASLSACDAALRKLLDGLVGIVDFPQGAFIATADRKNKLGVTALTTLALAHHPESSRYEETRKKLVAGMMWLQRPSGMFVTAFPPAEQLDAQDYFPGEALLAMAWEYEHEPSAEILDAFDRAISFYRSWFRENRSPAFVAWQVQAFAIMSRHTKRQDYIDFVLELSDWLAAMQLDAGNHPWAENWGGIASNQEGRVGVSTASYLEGFADALQVARRIGDARRTARYEEVVRRASRFVMQLQVRPEEAYFVRSPRDAIGGIRTSPHLNLLRIDHCQHALVALIKAREALFGDG